MYSEKPKLPYIRTNSGFDIYNHRRVEANQQNHNLEIQRSVSGYAWAGSFPGPDNVSAFSETSSPQSNTADCKTSRQFESLSFFCPGRKNFAGVRHRYCGNDSLWQPRKIQSGLQSQKARKAFVSGNALLRGLLQRILAWELKAGQYHHFHRAHSLHQGMPEQSTENYRKEQNPISDRFGMLWKSRYSFSRRYRMWIRNRSQTVSHHQKEGSGMQFYKDEKRMGNRGVLREGECQTEKRTQVCCNKISHRRYSERGKTAGIFQRQKICLPCFCHQSQSQSMENLPFLSAESHHRKRHQGTSLRFSHGENSHGQLDGQCRIFSVNSVCGKYCALVQKVMSAAGISHQNAGDYPDRLHCDTGEIDPGWKSKSHKPSAGFSLQKRIFAGITQHLQLAVAGEISFLQMADKVSQTIEELNYGVFTHF